MTQVAIDLNRKAMVLMSQSHNMVEKVLFLNFSKFCFQIWIQYPQLTKITDQRKVEEFCANQSYI